MFALINSIILRWLGLELYRILVYMSAIVTIPVEPCPPFPPHRASATIKFLTVETVLWWVLVLQPLSNAMFLQGWATQQCLFVWHVSFDWLRWKLFMPNVFMSLYTTGHSFPRCTWNNQISYHSISHGEHHVCANSCRYQFLHTCWEWIRKLTSTC